MKKNRKQTAVSTNVADDARKRRFLWIWAGVSLPAALFTGGISVWESNHRIPVDRYVKVYRQHGCTCAIAWAKTLEADGFVVSLFESHDLQAMRRYLHTPAEFRGCHVAEIGHYFVEGHVPGDILKQLMRDHPPGIGVAVVSHPPKDDSTSDVPDDIVILDPQGEKHPVSRERSADTLQF